MLQMESLQYIQYKLWLWDKTAALNLSDLSVACTEISHKEYSVHCISHKLVEFVKRQLETPAGLSAKDYILF